MDTDHFCAYGIDGLRCPRLGIFHDSTKPETGKSRWWCNVHILLINRGHTHADKQRLIAMMDDVRDSHMPRGSTRVARPTDALFEAELERLDLHRAPEESKDAFIARCKAKQKGDRRAFGQHGQRQLAQELLLAGEDPSDALNDMGAPDDADLAPW